MENVKPIENLSAAERADIRRHLAVPKAGDLPPRVGEGLFPAWALQNVLESYGSTSGLGLDWEERQPSQPWHSPDGVSELVALPDGEPGMALRSQGGRREYAPPIDGVGIGEREPMIVRARIYDPMSRGPGDSLAGREYLEVGDSSGLLAVGLHNSVDQGTFTAERYQFRTVGGAGWIQLETRRQKGWRLFEIVVADGRVYLYVDGHLDPMVEGLPVGLLAINRIYLGSLLSTPVDLYYHSVSIGTLQPRSLVRPGDTGPGALGAFAAGERSYAHGDGTTAVGENANAINFGATAVGKGSTAYGDRSVAVGDGTSAADSSVAVGRQAKADGDEGTAVGPRSDASGERAIAIGHLAAGNGLSAVALGRSAKGTGTNALAIGAVAEANGVGSVAMGGASKAAGLGAVAIGNAADAPSNQGVAIGAGAKIGPPEAIAIGPNASALMPNAVALGAQATQPDQAALGDRHVELGIVAEPSTAPAAGKARFFFREVNEFEEFCVQFSNGTVKVLTNNE